MGKKSVKQGRPQRMLRVDSAYRGQTRMNGNSSGKKLLSSASRVNLLDRTQSKHVKQFSLGSSPRNKEEMTLLNSTKKRNSLFSEAI